MYQLRVIALSILTVLAGIPGVVSKAETPQAACCGPGVRVAEVPVADPRDPKVTELPKTAGCYVLVYIYMQMGGVNYWYAMPCPSGGNSITVVSTFSGPSVSCSHCLASSCGPPGCASITTLLPKSSKNGVMVSSADIFQRAAGYGFTGTRPNSAAISAALAPGVTTVGTPTYAKVMDANNAPIYLELRVLRVNPPKTDFLNEDGSKFSYNPAEVELTMGCEVSLASEPAGIVTIDPAKFIKADSAAPIGKQMHYRIAEVNGVVYPVILFKDSEPQELSDVIE